ncbi:MAG: hypothetical protein ACRDR6_28900 [Pseudonocardiaceae bacterium]
MSTTEYSTDLDVRVEEDDTAAPQRASDLRRQYYYVEDGNS